MPQCVNKLISALSLCLLLAFMPVKVRAQSSRTELLQLFYDSLKYYQVYHPTTSMAIAMLETGCAGPGSRVKNFNYFGFRKRKYLTFKSQAESMLYLKRWQEKYYIPWLKKNPGKSYHKFLKHIHYAGNMRLFKKMIKKREKWIAENIDTTHLMAIYADTTSLQNER